MNRRRCRWAAPLLLLLAALASPASAQPLAERSLEVDGETIQFTVRVFSPEASRIDSSIALEPTTALNTARLIGQHLQNGASEDAALFSNSPRRRFEVLREYQESVGAEGFRKVYAEYFEPGNYITAELSIGDHSLLVWRLQGADRFAGQYYVRVEGKVYMNDIPSAERTRLRRLMEAIRVGRLQLPSQ